MRRAPGASTTRVTVRKARASPAICVPGPSPPVADALARHASRWTCREWSRDFLMGTKRTASRNSTKPSPSSITRGTLSLILAIAAIVLAAGGGLATVGALHWSPRGHGGPQGLGVVIVLMLTFVVVEVPALIGAVLGLAAINASFRDHNRLPIAGTVGLVLNLSLLLAPCLCCGWLIKSKRSVHATPVARFSLSTCPQGERGWG